MVARVTRAEQAAFGPAEALRLPNVGELANEVESGLGERWLDAFVRIEDQPPGAGSWPSRRDRWRRRRGLQATPGPGGECDNHHSTTGQFFDKKGASLAAPHLDPE